MTDFGMAPVKYQGSLAYFDPTDTIKTSKPHKETYWMEIPLKQGWTRKRVLKEVNKWLEERAWTTEPTKNPSV